MALIESLAAGTWSGAQLAGGVIVIVLYVIVGVLASVGSILVFQRMFLGRWEQMFWASFLVIIAAFYLSFAAYYGVTSHAWQTEVIGVAIFLGIAFGGLFSPPAIALGYMAHGLWDLSHSLMGTSLAGLSLTDIPVGYGVFCATFDFIVTYYIITSATGWHEQGKFDPLFWHHRAWSSSR